MTAEVNFRAFFDATPSPYLVLDTDLVIRYANRAYLQATHRTCEELVGKYFFERSGGRGRAGHRPASSMLRAVLGR